MPSRWRTCIIHFESPVLHVDFKSRSILALLLLHFGQSLRPKNGSLPFQILTLNRDIAEVEKCVENYGGQLSLGRRHMMMMMMMMVKMVELVFKLNITDMQLYDKNIVFVSFNFKHVCNCQGGFDFTFAQIPITFNVIFPIQILTNDSSTIALQGNFVQCITNLVC